MDYEVQRFTRHCTVSGRALQPGETYYSVLTADGDKILRNDYSKEEWKGPPEKTIGHWKAQIPSRDSRKVHWAPNDVMLHLIDELADEPQLADMRYVLALLLVRRRVARIDETEHDDEGRELLVLYSPKTEATYRVPVATPSEARIEQIQDELSKLLFSGS